MVISRISYRNIIGVQDLEISPVGKITELTGKNGAGKSTTINALFALIAGGREATLTPKSGTVGEAVIVVDTPEDSYTFRRTFKEDGAGPLSVKNGEGVSLPKPQDVMRRLINGMGANPVKFIQGTDAEQLDWLLKVVPLKVTSEQVSQAIGEECAGPVDGHALTVIDSIHALIYAARTSSNTGLKLATGDVDRLRAGLLPETGADYSAEAAKVRGVLRDLREEWNTRKAAISLAKSDGRAEIQGKASGSIKEIEDQLAAAIQDLREVAAMKARGVEVQFEVMAASLAETAEADQAKMEAELRPQTEKAAADLATATARAEEGLRSAVNRQHYEDKKADVERYALRSAVLTVQLDGLATLRKSLLTAFPIKGLEITDGKIVYKGVPLRSMSAGEQIKLAIQVASLSAGENGPIIVDGLEKLDPENLATFERIASKSPYQFFFTRVGSGPLKVTTHD